MTNSILQNIVEAWTAMSSWEIVAVLLGFAYLALVMRQNSLGWYAAFGSTSIFIWLFWDASLPMESALNVFYLLMAVYGWWSWRGGKEAKVLPIQRIAWQHHSIIFVAIAVLTVGSGYWLTHNTQAALPYLDSFTTWGAVITTVLVARKVLENWLYWLVIDSAALYLYIQRDLYLTAALMAVYLIMIIFGWLQWQADYKAQQNEKPTPASA